MDRRSRKGADIFNGDNQPETQGPPVQFSVWREGKEGVDTEFVQCGEQHSLYRPGQHRIHHYGGCGVHGDEE